MGHNLFGAETLKVAAGKEDKPKPVKPSDYKKSFAYKQSMKAKISSERRAVKEHFEKRHAKRQAAKSGPSK